LTRPKRGDEELFALYTSKVHFEQHVRTAVLNEADLVLELPRTAEEPAITERAATELQLAST
jgi:hypothetical protein